MNKLGFGFLRLPRLDPLDENSIDFDLLCTMVDRFLERGGRYFDTAYTYLGGASEEALKKALVERYPRERYLIADKLPGFEVKTESDNQRFFEESLARCGVDYFDVYLLHGINEENYEIAQKFDQFSFLTELKASGKAKKIGFSFHDTAQLLDRILTEQPEVDYVQLQINYLDWNSVSVQSRECYETAVQHGKRVLVMEPVKGGALADIPEKASAYLRALRPDDSPARWAIRFASDPEAVDVVLSGMNSLEQIKDNMGDFERLTQEEHAVLQQAARIICGNTAIACTGCGYCVHSCPGRIAIPQYFALFNEYKRNPAELWKSEIVCQSISKTAGTPADCVGCGQCEKRCPQKLPVIQWLTEIEKTFFTATTVSKNE